MREECAGDVSYEVTKKMAHINILDPIDYPEFAMIEHDMENTLVHELLHLHFAPISKEFVAGDEQYQLFEEQAIESISSGLIAVERKQVKV